MCNNINNILMCNNINNDKLMILMCNNIIIIINVYYY